MQIKLGAYIPDDQAQELAKRGIDIQGTLTGAIEATLVQMHRVINPYFSFNDQTQIAAPCKLRRKTDPPLHNLDPIVHEADSIIERHWGRY